ncbi:MAG: DUF2207 domain-containing protein, partial [Mycolicibacterium sp.]|nr:DUF2207 domain-containing protein [Mycolicibacterium sp.]
MLFQSTSASAPADDPVVITDYQADFTVGADGTLNAVEKIEGLFPSGRHGIFRYWDVANQSSPRVRQEPEITSILMDGEPVPYQLLWESGDRFRVAKIGDPDSTLPWGTHTYELRYTIPGVLDPGSTGRNKDFASAVGDPDSTSVFLWNVIAPSWNNEIDQVRVRATLPADVTGAECSVGVGVGRVCDGLKVSGNTVELSARDLAPRTPVTLRAGVEVPTPARISLPWSYEWDRVLGRSLGGVVWVVTLSVAGAALSYLWYRTTVEPAPGFPVQYAPPPGLGPVQTEYIRTESVPKNGLTATLFHLAERKLVALEQVDDEQWNVRATAEPGAWADVDPVSVAVGSALKVMRPGEQFEAKKSVSAGKRLTSAKNDMTAAVQTWATDGGLMVKRRKELWVRAANALAVVLAVCAFFRWGFPATMWGLPFTAFFLFSRRSWSDGVGTRRTEAGRRLWSQAGGFHRLLSTDSAETRFDFAARKDLYTAYIPFAIAGGAAALWAKKYQDTVGAVAPQPDWYNSSSSSSGWGFGSHASGPNFDSFESALSSSIGAYTASQSSSSSGGSSSGGGGGGGG